MSLSRKQILDITEKSSLSRLDLGHAVATYIGKSNDLAFGLFSLRPNCSFWVSYKAVEGINLVEKYTVVHGEIVVSYNDRTFILKEGETIDASKYQHLLSFYSVDRTDILIEMTECIYETNFRNTEIVEYDARAIEKVDGYTYGHCKRIKDYSIELWKRLDQPIERVSLLRWGAYFHDIGKLEIPLEILIKKGKLTSTEWEIMKTHTTKGAEMMRNHEIEWLRDSAFIVEQHHEQFDGNGYPFGLKGDEISLEAAIVSIVDSFDAMTTNRVYRDALSIEAALKEIIRCRGTQFHPVVVDAFLNLLHDKEFNWRYK